MSPFAPDTSHQRTPITVLTGFLGSGKTTVLNRALKSPQFADTAVIINEFGAIGLDHLLVEAVDGEMILLKSGCVCCTVRSDLETSLRELLARRDEGRIGFERIVVETTGLADPAPIAHLTFNNPLTAPFLRPARIVTTIDAPFGVQHLHQHWEARKQIALADDVLLTKGDLAAEHLPVLRDSVAALNPRAALHACEHGAIDPQVLLAQAAAPAFAALPHQHPHAHDEVQSISLTADVPLDWMRVQDWLSRLRAAHGPQLLRIKGVLDLQGEDKPVAVHGIHHVFHPPVRLREWLGKQRRSTLVVITRGLDLEEVRRTFGEEVAMASTSVRR